MVPQGQRGEYMRLKQVAPLVHSAFHTLCISKQCEERVHCLILTGSGGELGGLVLEHLGRFRKSSRAIMAILTGRFNKQPVV